MKLRKLLLLFSLLMFVALSFMACDDKQDSVKSSDTLEQQSTIQNSESTPGQSDAPTAPSETTTPEPSETAPSEPKPSEPDPSAPGPSEPDPSEAETYQIAFKDDAGNLIHCLYMKKGEIPSYTWSGKADTPEWQYTFKGWSTSPNGTPLSSLPAVSGDTTYYSIIEAVKRKYIVTLQENNGKSETFITKEYGETLSQPQKPQKDGYLFVSWCTDKNLSTPVQWPLTITGNITLYASWNKQVDIKGYLSQLLNSYQKTPYSYIPPTMLPGYAANTISPDAVSLDYSHFVSVSDIQSGGFGEQWHMVADNLYQSQLFFRVLETAEGLTSSSIVAFNNYIDQNPANTAHYNFKDGIYSITINFDGEKIFYVIDYSANVPALGNQTVQIAMLMNIETEEKEVRIQIGNSNALRYKIKNNSYEFALQYLNSRSVYFSFNQLPNGSVEGRIYESLTLEGKEIASAADFYIDDNYVSVVGNKASGIPGFSGYINELYRTSTGKLLGYEVRESLSSIVYNTLWFDFSYVSGIDSIRYQEKTDSAEEAFYLNDSDTAFAVKKVGGLSVKRWSRRYDIEFRTQYFYVYDAEKDSYKEVSVKTPMLFIQEEVYTDFNKDVKSENSNLDLSVSLSGSDQQKIRNDYATLVDSFIEHKDNFSFETISSFIGEKIAFSVS